IRTRVHGTTTDSASSARTPAGGVHVALEPIYEQDFKYFSYGFRPGRSAHEALSCIWSQCTTQGIKWILDVDVRKCFDTITHEPLGAMLDLRVRDGVLRRLIGKWLKAGVLDA